MQNFSNYLESLLYHFIIFYIVEPVLMASYGKDILEGLNDKLTVFLLFSPLFSLFCTDSKIKLINQTVWAKIY